MMVETASITHYYAQPSYPIPCVVCHENVYINFDVLARIDVKFGKISRIKLWV